MEDRDMMYGGYYQGMPGNMMYGNFGFQGMPGSLMGGMPNMAMGGYGYQNPNIIDLNGNTSNPITDLNNRINNLENRVKVIEQRLGNSNSNSYQDDNSMYMI